MAEPKDPIYKARGRYLAKYRIIQEDKDLSDVNRQLILGFIEYLKEKGDAQYLRLKK